MSRLLEYTLLHHRGVILLLFIASHYSHAQYSDSHPATGYAPLKWYKIIPYDKNQFSYVLTKGTEYQLSTISDDSLSRGIVDIMIFNSKRKLVASNKADPSQPDFRFTCKSSGIYYIICLYERRQPSLMLTLSFSRKTKKRQKPITE